MFSRMTLLPLALLGISAFFYTVQAAPTAIGTRGSTEIDTLGGGRVKRQGGGCGCCGGCGCGCCGCGGGGGGCGCCCCRPQCCCQKCCTCCKTCCCTRCCTCCRPCCCGCGCGCCGCGGGRKRRTLQNLRIRLADKKAKRSVEVSALPAAYQEDSVVEQSAVAQQEPVILPLDFKSEAENAQE